ncbi:MAG: BNR repeat-containing protein, partial [Odoribacter sp.]|nr:BNR repeat-containing protein [Odoribacter sp.]
RYIDLVPSDFPVNFSLFTKGEYQYIGYYDTAHIMTIASRKLDSEKWEYKKLDSKVGWDSHNCISLFVDDAGYIHVSGNMHSNKLNYFKSSKPWDIQAIERQNGMVGSEEDRCTYPEFMVSNNGEVLFHYRHGGSGNGYEIFNVLDVEKQEWKRLLDKPLIDGEGKMNAYMHGPILGKDGFYHLIWVWRDTPDCSTNHTLSYARSKDLINWESIRGEKVSLPITIKDEVLVVDNTPVKGGLINIGIKLGFDSNNQPVIGYHKYDENGNTQLFLSRYEEDEWKKVQQTNWNYRWDFKGTATIVNELLIEEPKPEKGKKLSFVYHRMDIGDGQIIADEKSLLPLKEEKYIVTYPKDIENVESDFPGMLVYKIEDKGEKFKNKRYILRWEALLPNRDKRRTGDLPAPSVLRLLEIK